MCKVDYCDRPALKEGLCAKHVPRMIAVPMYQGGQLVGTKEVDPFTIEEREALIGMVAQLRAVVSMFKHGDCWCREGDAFINGHSLRCTRASEVLG